MSLPGFKEFVPRERSEATRSHPTSPNGVRVDSNLVDVECESPPMSPLYPKRQFESENALKLIEKLSGSGSPAERRGRFDSKDIDRWDRHHDEAANDAEELESKYTEWVTLHPERAKEVAKYAKVGEQRAVEFEDDGTVDALLLAFMRDVTIRAQDPERDLPPGVQSKLVHVVRHGQGFHNMLEAMPPGADGFAGVEGEVRNQCEDVEEDGISWLQMETFEGIFTSHLGPRNVLGIETSGAAEFVLAHSADGGASWKELPPLQSPSPNTSHKQAPFGKDKKGHAKGVMCTHVRVRPLTPTDAKMKLVILVPAVARNELQDPSLTSKGRQEALSSHHDALANGLNPDLVVVSPVTRATQTGLIAFQHLIDTESGQPKVPFIAHEGVHERGGANTCDWRRPLPELKRDFPNIDYSLIKSVEDPLWDPARESQSSMIKRLYDFLIWLRDRPEEEVAIVAHCSINFTLLNAVVDCSIDPNIARWFCTGETRSMRILWEKAQPKRSKFTNDESHMKGLANGLCQLYPNVMKLPAQGLSGCTNHIGQREDVVLVRQDYKEHAEQGRVAIVTSGGAGHEPFCAGFVGAGLLTAVALGQGLFATPSPGAILHAIKEVAAKGSGGCVLLVMNYAGVRFNSSIAALHAQRDGIKVEQVLVADDVARPLGANVEDNEGRGVAGTLLVLKAAGAKAERGGSLQEVAQAARSVARGVFSMAIAQRDDAGEDSVEVGVGIHGEPGTEKLSSFTQLPGSNYGVADAVVRRLIRGISPAVHLRPGKSVILVLNNLGGMSELEMAILSQAACSHLNKHNSVKVVALLKGTLMTCLNMHGASLSILPVEGNDILELMQAPVAEQTAWPGVTVPSQLTKFDAPYVANPRHAIVEPADITPSGQQLRRAIKEACSTLAKPETIVALNEMDDVCGDGDCGTTHSDAALLLLNKVDSFPGALAHEVLHSIAMELEMSCRGAIGGIYVLGFQAAAQHLLKCDKPEPAVEDWAAAARAALECIQEQGGAKEGDRTIVDAMAPAVKALEQHAAEGGEKALAAAVLAAKKGAKDTQRMVAKKGRAMNVPAKEQSRWQDAGAVGFAKWVESVQRSLR